MAAVDGTIDLYWLDDFKPHMPEVSGRVALLHRAYRRITTKRGTMPWWPNDGLDVREFLLGKHTPDVIARNVTDELQKDEQVEAALVNVESLNFGRQMRIKIVLIDSDGPFSFTLDITTAALNLVDLQGV